MQGGSAALDFFEDVRSLGRPDKRLGLLIVLRNTARRIRGSVRSRKNLSTIFSHDAEGGVKCRRSRYRAYDGTWTKMQPFGVRKAQRSATKEYTEGTCSRTCHAIIASKGSSGKYLSPPFSPT